MARAAALALLLCAAGLAGAGGAGGAAAGCAVAGCACSDGGARLTCADAALRRLPPLHADLLELDVSNNNISTLPRDALLPAIALRDLNLSANRLESAEDNLLSDLEESALSGLRSLRTLRLARNQLRALPAGALAGTPHLQVLELGGNLISELGDGALPPLPSLHTLILKRNRITHIEERAFVNTPALRILRLEENLLTELPTAVRLLPVLEDLSLASNRVEWVGEEVLQSCRRLARLELRANPLGRLEPRALQRLPHITTLAARQPAGPAGATRAAATASYYHTVSTHTDTLWVYTLTLARLELRANPLGRLEPRALQRLPHITTLIMSEARGLRSLPSLSGCVRLRTLRADRARLSSLPTDFCRDVPQLRTLDLKLNKFDKIPDLRECSELRSLDLSTNEITTLEASEADLAEGEEEGASALHGLSRLQDLALAHNMIRRVPRHAFRPTPQLQTLNLEGNLIEHIDMEAFVPVSKLEDLNVGENQFPWLPSAGLQRLRHLKAHNNPNLRQFHPPEALPSIEVSSLSDDEQEPVPVAAVSWTAAAATPQGAQQPQPQAVPPARGTAQYRAGLQQLRHLKAHNNPNLRQFHPPEALPNIEVSSLSDDEQEPVPVAAVSWAAAAAAPQGAQQPQLQAVPPARGTAQYRAGLQRLRHLKAHNNPNLRQFHPPEALPNIEVSSLGSCLMMNRNQFPWLPSTGLHLKAHNNPNLRQFHPPEALPNIEVSSLIPFLPTTDRRRYMRLG
ncbi:leucine rich repeat domain-containing protein [Phthorimaea operculella]|nr:leucine rich repeat domain-containing protein [Phthorimaea operculella]